MISLRFKAWYEYILISHNLFDIKAILFGIGVYKKVSIYFEFNKNYKILNRLSEFLILLTFTIFE